MAAELFLSIRGIVSLLLCGGLVVAALFDLRSRTVPNALTVALLVGGLIARAGFAGFSAAGWGLLTAMGALAFLTPIFAKGWLGGGDVKLLVALAAWLGARDFAHALLAATLAGGVLAILMLLRRGRRALALREASKTRGVPYAVAIAIGGLVVILPQGGIPGLV